MPLLIQTLTSSSRAVNITPFHKVLGCHCSLLLKAKACACLCVHVCVCVSVCLCVCLCWAAAPCDASLTPPPLFPRLLRWALLPFAGILFVRVKQAKNAGAERYAYPAELTIGACALGSAHCCKQLKHGSPSPFSACACISLLCLTLSVFFSSPLIKPIPPPFFLPPLTFHPGMLALWLCR